MNQQIQASPQPQPTPEPAPVAKPVTNPAIRTLNDKYVGKISNGEIDVGTSRGKQSPEQAYERRVKQKKLSQASREKEQLERRLAYLNRSIQSIKDYEYSSGKASPIDSPPKSPLSDPKQFIKKTQQFHDRVRQQRRKCQQRKELQKQRQQQKIKAESQQRLKRQQQAKAKRKQQIYENMQKIKQRMEGRESDIKRRQQDYQKINSGSTLYKKIQQQFAQQQVGVLEERKKKLANIRNLHRPVSIAEIEEHERKFFEALREKESLRERERRLGNATQEYKVSYKSPRHKALSQQRMEEQNESKVKADKMRQFSQHVRQNFAPQVDESKRENIEKQLEQQRQRARRLQGKQQLQKQRVQQIRSKGLRYLEEVKDLPKRRDSKSSNTPAASDRTQYKNYLTHTERAGRTNWGSILCSNVDKREKAMRLQVEAERMERSLEMREEKVRVLKGDPDQVDQQYFEMIKAKLDLLQI